MRRQRLAGEALGWLIVARLLLRWLPVKNILAYVARTPRQARPEEARARATLKEVRWAVLSASRHAPVEMVCFPQCLAALTMLRRRGIASRLHYGVARLEGRLETHTWLEVDGVILIGGEVAGDFSRMATY